MSVLPLKTDTGRKIVCKRNCKRTTRHTTTWRITNQDRHTKNREQEHTLSYRTAQANMRILELENRCTGNRTVGSNPTLSVPTWFCIRACGGFIFLTPNLTPTAVSAWPTGGGKWGGRPLDPNDVGCALIELLTSAVRIWRLSVGV
jgi:hypothetical protein